MNENPFSWETWRLHSRSEHSRNNKRKNKREIEIHYQKEMELEQKLIRQEKQAIAYVNNWQRI